MSTTFTYDAADATALDQVRTRLGDVKSSEVLLYNETISALLSKYSNDVDLSVQEGCLIIVAKLARDTTQSGGAGTQSKKEKADRYVELFKTYREMNAARGTPFVGGASVSENDELRGDTDLVQPRFQIGMDDLTDPPKATDAL